MPVVVECLLTHALLLFINRAPSIGRPSNTDALVHRLRLLRRTLRRLIRRRAARAEVRMAGRVGHLLLETPGTSDAQRRLAAAHGASSCFRVGARRDCQALRQLRGGWSTGDFVARLSRAPFSLASLQVPNPMSAPPASRSWRGRIAIHGVPQWSLRHHAPSEGRSIHQFARSDRLCGRGRTLRRVVQGSQARTRGRRGQAGSESNTLFQTPDTTMLHDGALATAQGRAVL
jgi:hypothetical protein